MSARPPIAMLAELTHRCPLSCPYCSNPMELTRKERELDTATWLDVFRQAAAMGVLHLHLSGGEPLSRRDLEALVAGARAAELYTNLITSGIGLTEKRLAALVEAGLDHVQLSLQGTDAATGDRIGGYRGGFARKMEAAGWIAAAEVPLTLNFVMHRQNIAPARGGDRAGRAAWGAADRGRDRAVPRLGDGEPRGADADARAGAGRRRGRCARRGSGCAGGSSSTTCRRTTMRGFRSPAWAGGDRRGSTSTPKGGCCPAMRRRRSPGSSSRRCASGRLAAIWEDGPAFTAFRGTDWMQEPCRSCERRDVDFGGCRCQAMALAGDAARDRPGLRALAASCRAGGAGRRLRGRRRRRWSGESFRRGARRRPTADGKQPAI